MATFLIGYDVEASDPTVTRAFLGASNPARTPAQSRLTEPVAGDDIPLADYAPHERGGPLHLVNACLNETVMGRLDVEQRDRHGRSVAVGPAVNWT